MGWHYWRETCHDGVCGEAIVTCLYCRADAHCDYFPEDWVRCCIMMSSLDGHLLNHHTVFCSRKCEIKYTIANMSSWKKI